MPIFEFHCHSCNQDFEKLVFGADPEVECPHCGQAKVEKLMSACVRQGGGQVDRHLQRQQEFLHRLRRNFLQHLRVIPFSCRGAPRCAPSGWADTQVRPYDLRFFKGKCSK